MGYKKINIYTLCFNEMDILPFVKQYWDYLISLGVELKVVVFDNGSTDGSIEFLQNIPYVEIRPFKTEGMNDAIHMYIKNTCWKEAVGNVDWVIVSDMDEIIYPKSLSVFDKADENDAAIIETGWYTLVEDKKPSFNPNKLLHQITTKWNKHPSYGKYLIFNPNKVKEINFSPGAHTIRPIGNGKIYKSDDTYAFHTNKGFGIQYKIDKYRYLNNRLSETNKSHHWCIHYSMSDEDIINEYKQMQMEAVDLSGQ